MGGGGGYRDFNIDRPRLHERAAAGTEEKVFDTEVNQLLVDMLREYNDRDVDTIRQHLETIESAISQVIDNAIEMLYGGSIQKHTYVNGLSDVDMLVCLNESLSNQSPQDILKYLESALRQRFPRTTIKVGDLAVTVQFSDGHEVQLLPAIKTDQGFRIARTDAGGWSNVISPHRFAEKLTAANRRLDGKLVPMIKLVKSINDTLPRPSRLSGYHVESLAIEAFKSYNGRMTQKEMIQHFWREAQQLVLQPIKDSSGQSVHVDDYLGSANSSDRLRVSSAIGNISRKLERADRLRSVDNWQELLEI